MPEYKTVPRRGVWIIIRTADNREHLTGYRDEAKAKSVAERLSTGLVRFQTLEDNDDKTHR